MVLYVTGPRDTVNSLLFLQIWSMKYDVFLNDFRENGKDMNKIKWSPIAAGTSNPNHHMMLARYPISCYIHIYSFFHMWW
uniref:Uncharacterized protein n=1 Tax=Solanum lycopersicum TaxID=4081 RepID=K4CCZ2_SOLLC